MSPGGTVHHYIDGVLGWVDEGMADRPVIQKDQIRQGTRLELTKVAAVSQQPGVGLGGHAEHLPGGQTGRIQFKGRQAGAEDNTSSSPGSDRRRH